MEIFTLNEIKKRINVRKILNLQEEGFKAYSSGRVNAPPIGYIKIGHTPVSYHIKYGMIEGDDVFVVKLAGGLEQTTKKFGPAKMEGMMLVISACNGKPLYLLQDEGYLTNLRTAMAGLISAKYLAPKKNVVIGVLGTGIQARLQVEFLKEETRSREVYVWGRNAGNMQKYKSDMEEKGFSVYLCQNASEVAKKSNLIITTTPSERPLLDCKDIRKGSHITAVGADSPGKQELDPKIFSIADLVAVDSKRQCLDHGELSYVCRSKSFDGSRAIELGKIIENPMLARVNDSQTTIVDLTGIAIQDIQMAKAVLFE